MYKDETWRYEASDWIRIAKLLACIPTTPRRNAGVMHYLCFAGKT